MKKLKLRIKYCGFDTSAYIMQRKRWIFWFQETDNYWKPNRYLINGFCNTWEECKKQAIEYMNQYYIDNVHRFEIDKSKVYHEAAKVKRSWPDQKLFI